MRKLLTILILFCSVVCFSQEPRQLNGYNPLTQINFLGTAATDSGFVLRTNFADTATANLGWLKGIPNLVIVVNDSLWKRSNDATFWMRVGSGSGGGGGGSTLTLGTFLTGGSYNGTAPITTGIDTSNAALKAYIGHYGKDSVVTIYTGDGSLSGDRIIDLDGKSLFIQYSGFNFLSLDATPDAEQSFLSAHNATGGGNNATVSMQVHPDYSTSTLSASFNDGNTGGAIVVYADVDDSYATYTADTHTFNGSIIYNTPPSGSITDSFLLWNSSTGTIEKMAIDSLVPNLVFNQVGVGQITVFARNDSLFSKNVKDTLFIKWATSPADSSLKAYLDTSSVALHTWISIYGGGSGGIVDPGSNGILSRTALNTVSARTITGTTNRLSVTDGNGVSANPTLDISSAYVGQATITTLGTIVTGVWNGTAIANANLANSTISGISLGSNLTDLTVSTGLQLNSGATYNGGTAKTISIDATVATLSGTQTFTNKRITKRTSSISSNANPTFNTDNFDILEITAQAADITSMTTNLSGTGNDGDRLEVRITGTASRAITWGASFASSTVTLPTSTSSTTTLTVFFEWQSNGSNANKWVCIGWA